MISGKGGFTGESSLHRHKREGKQEKRERKIEKRCRTGSKTDKAWGGRGKGNILKDAFKLNAADEIVLVKKRVRWNGRWIKKDSEREKARDRNERRNVERSEET